jgi:hypothetical protein
MATQVPQRAACANLARLVGDVANLQPDDHRLDVGIGGRLALADIMLPDNLPWAAKLFYREMSTPLGVPFANFVNLATYRSQLAVAGFTQITVAFMKTGFFLNMQLLSSAITPVTIQVIQMLTGASSRREAPFLTGYISMDGYAMRSSTR